MKRWASVLTVVALSAVLLVGQASADAISDPVDDRGLVGTNEVFQDTGFAYLAGLRQFAAAVLWNRLDPIHHGYYHELSLGEQTYLAPNIWLITRLDPEFAQAYYIGAWMVSQAGDWKTGLALAREGAELNPNLGLLQISYAQMLFIEDSLDEAVSVANGAWGADYLDANEEWEALAIAKAIYTKAGEEESATIVQARKDELDAYIHAHPELFPQHECDHDH